MGESTVGRPREVEDEAIFGATGRALSRLGYARLSLAAVASEAGVSPAMLVKRFGSKRDLLLAFFDWSIASSRALFAAARQEHASPLGSLLARFLLRLEYTNDPVSVANVLSFYTETIGDPEFAERGARRLRMQHAEIQRLLDEAVARGELVACDTARVGRVLLAAMNGALLLWEPDAARSMNDGLRDVFDVVLGPLRAAGRAVPATEV